MRAANPILFACVVLTLVGCGEPDAQVGTGGAPGTGGVSGTGGTPGGAGMGGDPGTPALAPLAEAPRFAVVSSDYSETTVAVLDSAFEVLDESWINSGTTFPGLVATLSGDVVLPTRQAGDGTVTLIDRLLTDVVSRFHVPSGNLAGQARTHGEVSDYSSNPRDFIFVNERSGWATRYEPNLDPDATPENAGTDLLEIDPATMVRTGQRIDLAPFNTTASVPGASDSDEVMVHARPSRGVRVGSTLVVGLDRLSGRFDAAGQGMVAVVDLDDGSTDGLALDDGLASCGTATTVPGAPTKVMVACTGFARPFGDAAQTRASAGIVRLSVDANGATVERTWRASDDVSSAIAVESVVALDEARVVAVDFGDFASNTPDALYVVDLETGAQSLLHESPSAFEIGPSAYDPINERLYVPDAGENAVIEITITETGGRRERAIPIAPGIGFPPRAVYRLE